MYDDTAKRESFYHAALLYMKDTPALKNIKVGNPRNPSPERHLGALLEKHGSFENVFSALTGWLGSSYKQPMEMLKGVKRALYNLDFDFYAINVNDELYPAALRNVEGATPVLYCRGNIDMLKGKSIAVIGTRGLDDVLEINSGRQTIKRLVDKDYTIISGLATGCDTLAHKSALEYCGKTIAVLGTPLERYYPKSNRELQDRIAAEHLIISQYPIGIRVFPSYFANRNRTVAGLATEGVVVISAGDKSGTQHAIRHCIEEQDKRLYVLRHNLGRGYDWVNRYWAKYGRDNGKHEQRMFVVNNSEKGGKGSLSNGGEV